MVFEEQYFCKLLNGIDCSEEKITETSNYMLKYIDNYKIIVDIWFNFFKSSKLSEALHSKERKIYNKIRVDNGRYYFNTY